MRLPTYRDGRNIFQQRCKSTSRQLPTCRDGRITSATKDVKALADNLKATYVSAYRGWKTYAHQKTTSRLLMFLYKGDGRHMLCSTYTSNMEPCRVRNVSNKCRTRVSCVFLRIRHVSTCCVHFNVASSVQHRTHALQNHLIVKILVLSTLPLNKKNNKIATRDHQKKMYLLQEIGVIGSLP